MFVLHQLFAISLQTYIDSELQGLSHNRQGIHRPIFIAFDSSVVLVLLVVLYSFLAAQKLFVLFFNSATPNEFTSEVVRIFLEFPFVYFTDVAQYVPCIVSEVTAEHTFLYIKTLEFAQFFLEYSVIVFGELVYNY